MLTLRNEIRACLLGILIWIPLGSLLLPILIFFYTASHLVHFLAKLFHPELIPITKFDAFTAFAPSNTPMSYVYTCQVWRVKGLLDVSAFRNHFQQCFLSNEEDRRKYANLYCHFVQYLGYILKKRVKQLDLHWHIHEHYLDDGTGLDGFVGEWMTTHDSLPGSSSDMERPTWMIKLIRNEVTKETTVLWKLHHGICDGYTIVHLVGKLSGQNAPYMYKDPEPPLLKKIKTLIQFPYWVGEMWTKMYQSKREGKMFLEYQPLKKCKEENWLISYCTLNLETVKAIRRVTKTNFVSVLMSIQMGALKRFLKEVKPDARALKESPVETFIGHSMGWPNHPVPTKGGGMANHLTLNSVNASFHLEDPLERLLDLDNNFRETKSKGIPVLANYFMFNLMKHAPWLARKLINRDLSVVAAETGLSSLLGSPNKHYLLGHPVEHIWLPVITPSLFPRMKLMTVPVSHSGVLDISVNAGAALVKNQELLDRLTNVHFQEELDALRIRCQQIVE